jgi:hypothetical protein
MLHTGINHELHHDFRRLERIENSSSPIIFFNKTLRFSLLGYHTIASIGVLVGRLRAGAHTSSDLKLATCSPYSKSESLLEGPAG